MVRILAHLGPRHLLFVQRHLPSHDVLVHRAAENLQTTCWLPSIDLLENRHKTAARIAPRSPEVHEDVVGLADQVAERQFFAIRRKTGDIKIEGRVYDLLFDRLFLRRFLLLSRLLGTADDQQRGGYEY